ncbi:MAG: hypothetical protein J6I71_06915, partial [Campylobacter sp.]|uniref:hypothetical protein n=1 Tax=Campylobacter sp. TaxID=205 RepID=UPI001B4946C9
TSYNKLLFFKALVIFFSAICFSKLLIIEKGKNIISSELGRQLYSVAPQILTSVDLKVLAMVP